MKNRHIGELKIVNEDSFMDYKCSTDDLIFNRTTKLIFNFKKHSIDVQGSVIKLQEDGTLKIECGFYNDKLFNAYRHKDKILTLEVKGILADINDTSKLFPYSQTYKKYKFISVQGSFECDGYWIYILRPCL